MSLLMGGAILLAVQAVKADEMGTGAGMSTPGAASTPVAKPAHKIKKAKKKSTKAAVQAVWACPMGHYSGPKTADGKCPTCGMDLVQKK